MVYLFFILTAILFFLGMPVAIAVGLPSIFYILLMDFENLVIIQQLFSGVNVEAFLAIPMFILVGELMNSGGMANRLLNLANSMVGKISGGLGIVAVLSVMFFSAISGSAVATAATFGALLIPAMVQRGYDKNFSGAVIASAAPMGAIIPPSITLILYGVMTQTSIKDLYMAGIPAGILFGLGLIIVIVIISRKRGYKGSNQPFSIKELSKALLQSLWALGAPIILIGGVFGGWFTPTESGVVAVVYAIIVCMFIYKELKFKEIINALFRTAKVSSEIMIIIANAMLFAYVLTYESIPQKIVQYFLSVTDNLLIILLIINILFLIAGTFMESSAIVILLVPLTMPIIMEFNFDPVLFGIIVTINTAIGMATPPLGLTLFTASRVGNLKVQEVSYRTLPFIIISILILFIITYIPLLFM